MQPTIIENYTDIGIDVGRIVRRIFSHLPPDILDGLKEVRILDKHERAFACYRKGEAVIEIYVSNLLGDFPPIFLKVFYPFTFMVIGMAVGHEIDHHVNRNKNDIDREASAKANILKYIYPSFGIFKHIMRVFAFIGRPFRKSLMEKIKKMETG